MIKLCPSIICSDLLHLEDEVRKMERNNIDFIHFDISDTTFVPMIMLYPGLIEQLKKITKIPLDIHVMVNQPDRLLDYLLKITDENDYICVHKEACSSNLASYIERIKQAGRHAGVVINISTGLDGLEYISKRIDSVTVLNGIAGTPPRCDCEDETVKKIADVKKLLEKTKNDHCFISVDGGVNFVNSLRFRDAGCEAFVLGTNTVYMKNTDFDEQVKKYRSVMEG